VVRVDHDGYFYVLDRKKDMINRAGLKVWPAKVEHVLQLHPQVADAAVVGAPDLPHTESVVAVVVPCDRGGGSARLAGHLRSLCREHLAPYEVPQRFVFVDHLPRSPLGKLNKSVVRRMIGAGAASDPAAAGADPTLPTVAGAGDDDNRLGGA
jgi:acyl-coenzyme A synthetase/AMP-(fatty) acid ligase